MVAFIPGTLTGEFAPHILAATAADTVVSIARGKASKPSVAVAAATMAGLGYLIASSVRARTVLDQALTDGLGADYVEQLDHRPTPAELTTPWASLINPFDWRDKRVQVERNVAYSDAGTRGHLDIYRPAGRDLVDAPVLLQVHGGGWTTGEKDHQSIPLMKHLAALGWVCVAINYRLAKKHPFPAQVIDVKRAIAWIKENIGEYGGDPSYLAITGGSAGAHLASLAALTPGDPDFQPGFEDADTSVQAAVPHYGTYDFAGATGLPRAIYARDTFFGPLVLHRRWADSPEAFEAASPILRITPDAPDFFVIHGANDTMAPAAEARLFVERLRETSKRSVVYAELPGAQHAFDVFPSIRSVHVFRAVERYLTWHWNSTKHHHLVKEALDR